MSKKNITPKMSISIGYFGVWRDDNTVGWCGPRCFYGTEKYPVLVEAQDWNKGEWSYKCEVIIKPIRSEKTGKFIRRRIK